MSHEITLNQAAEMAHQAEMVCLLMKRAPEDLEDCDVYAIASLLARLTGSVSAWLIEEQAQQEGNA